MKTKITIRVEEERKQKFRFLCKKHEVPMSKVFEEVIDMVIDGRWFEQYYGDAKK